MGSWSLLDELTNREILSQKYKVKVRKIPTTELWPSGVRNDVYIYTKRRAGDGLRVWVGEEETERHGGGVGSLDPHKYLHANLYSCLLYVGHKKGACIYFN